MSGADSVDGAPVAELLAANVPALSKALIIIRRRSIRNPFGKRFFFEKKKQKTL